MAAENKTYDVCSLYQCPAKPSKPHSELCDLSSNIKCVPHLRKQRGPGHQKITEAFSMFRFSPWHTQDWNQKTSRCLLGQPREIACGCLAFSHCWGSILSSSPCGSPAPLPGRRCSCPWTMWELLTWFLKHPKSPGLVTPVETHLRLGAAPVAAGWGWSLAHGSFLYLQIWSEKCFSFPDHTTHLLILFYWLFCIWQNSFI